MTQMQDFIDAAVADGWRLCVRDEKSAMLDEPHVALLFQSGVGATGVELDTRHSFSIGVDYSRAAIDAAPRDIEKLVPAEFIMRLRRSNVGVPETD